MDAYLSDGVQVIWLVDPQRKTIVVYAGSDEPHTVRLHDTLSGGELLAHFTMPLKSLFA